eukprot:3086375-Pyramimonas_sp.AAC.1
MVADPKFWESYLMFGRRSKVCNMHIERLLAHIRQSLPADMKAPCLERVCGNGMLAQCLSHFVAAGGDDPRKDTLANARRLGLTLRRDVPKKNQPTRKMPACNMFANTYQAARLAQCPGSGRAGLAAVRRDLAQEFH